MKALDLAFSVLCLLPPAGVVAQDLDAETLEQLKRVFGVENYDHIQVLQKALQAKDPDSRARGIRFLKPDLMPDTAVRILLKVLQEDESPRVRKAVAEQLGSASNFAGAFVKGPTMLQVSITDALLHAMRDREHQVRLAAALAFQRLYPDSELPVPVLIEALGYKDLKVQLEALANMGWTVIRPLLVGSFDSKDKNALIYWFQQFQAGDRRDRVAAAQVLARLGPKARPAVPALRWLLFDPNPDVRMAADRALASITPSGKK